MIRFISAFNSFFDFFISGLPSFSFGAPAVGLPFGIAVAAAAGEVTFPSISSILFTAQEQENEIWVAVVVVGR